MTIVRSLFLVFTSALISVSAIADKPVLVLFPVEVGAGDAEMASEFGSALQEGLAERYQVYFGAQVESELEKEYQKIDCDAERCAQNVAMAFNGELVADASAKRIGGGYVLKLVIQNAMTGALIESNTLPCRGCDVFSVIDNFKLMGQGKTAKAVSPDVAVVSTVAPVEDKAAILLFDSTPSGADVVINGRSAGKTPYQGLQHRLGESLKITLSHAGYDSHSFDATLDRELTRLAQPVVLRRQPSREEQRAAAQKEIADEHAKRMAKIQTDHDARMNQHEIDMAKMKADNKARVEAMYRIEEDPVEQWPQQQQLALDELQGDFVARYHRDYAQGAIKPTQLSLIDCDLWKKQNLKIANLSVDALSVNTKGMRSKSTLKVSKISLASTAQGCEALDEVSMWRVPDSTIAINRLPANFPHPLYLEADYSLHTKYRMGKTTHDGGVAQHRLKFSRIAGPNSDYPWMERRWWTTEPGKGSDERLKYLPSYMEAYYPPANEDSLQAVTLIRQTVMNKTANSISIDWRQGRDYWSRHWARNMVVGKIAGEIEGIIESLEDNGEVQLRCHVEGEAVKFFRRQGDYDCTEAREGDYGQDHSVEVDWIHKMTMSR